MSNKPSTLSAGIPATDDEVLLAVMGQRGAASALPQNAGEETASDVGNALGAETGGEPIPGARRECHPGHAPICPNFRRCAGAGSAGTPPRSPSHCPRHPDKTPARSPDEGRYSSIGCDRDSDPPCDQPGIDATRRRMFSRDRRIASACPAADWPTLLIDRKPS